MANETAEAMSAARAFDMWSRAYEKAGIGTSTGEAGDQAENEHARSVAPNGRDHVEQERERDGKHHRHEPEPWPGCLPLENQFEHWGDEEGRRDPDPGRIGRQ